MIVIPSIDISGGYAVKRVMGVRGTELVRLSIDDAIKLVRDFSWVHIVDLDGAELGKPVNISSIGRISEEFKRRCEVGGGIRTPETGKEILRFCERVVLGTTAVEKPSVVKDFINELGYESVAVSIDVKDDRVMSRGWSRPVGELESVINSLPRVHVMIYTAINVEGTGRGLMLNPRHVDLLRGEADLLFYAGGVSSCNDIERLRNFGFDGVIIGYALYVKGVRCDW
ncbi:HisA/HisF-related TIM barrel protein [Vulcanisaeta souniana]|uniref:1-(5-phosphoribosyl)-5-((5-phosphoribosylamino)methylideneamino)imidazole-4-carboxamide isomerase n=1 Tax=Vulcanisaeta souniana JCM 11219 TaxID=1293586 RepID=A0A830EKD7_9CREN|nr:HisA/HisF-related TIM barrel protein [Vulcanisaeta souniana]BDR92893.1 1-(5-phosphoribosyl)-5-[(5-phosphoribosylamino) methylideneamino] imidazole-4-carboxamide isomerase [Vulcanisaeta souniana JCM 11219]GGI85439.1 1-(5-phosphoribosyl)-5-((5-phosphoribosylamino)methylideneamino)imidazole-4-carboxamide isomerase [Vulcanisaeta souniana JCM 11219]